MASMRVHELAKEFGMDSKVLLSRIQDLKIAAKSHASVLSEANVEKIREALAPELGAKAAAGMDAEAAAKAQAEKAAADEKKAEEERARRAAVERERELRAEERARREHNSAAKGEASAAAASAKQAKRPPAPAVNSGLSSLARQIEEQKAAAEHRRKKAAQDARAAKLAAEVAKKKAVAEALANRGAKKPAAKPAAERRPKPAPTAAPRKSSFDSLLSQIEAEKNRLTAEKAARPSRNGNAAAGNKKNAKGAGKRGGHHFEPDVPELSNNGEDRYAQMAVQAEKMQRDKVLAEARAAGAAASNNEGEGRR